MWEYYTNQKVRFWWIPWSLVQLVFFFFFDFYMLKITVSRFYNVGFYYIAVFFPTYRDVVAVTHTVNMISICICSWISIFFNPGRTFQSANQIWGTGLQFMSRLGASTSPSDFMDKLWIGIAFVFWTGMLIQEHVFPGKISELGLQTHKKYYFIK